MSAIHAPDRRKKKSGQPGGDDRNTHVHMLTTTRVCDATGCFTNKVRELDSYRTRGREIRQIRQAWAEFANKALENAGHRARIDHRSLIEQGIHDRLPTRHIGPKALQIASRDLGSDRLREWQEVAAANERLAAAAAESKRIANEIDAIAGARETKVWPKRPNSAKIQIDLSQDILSATQTHDIATGQSPRRRSGSSLGYGHLLLIRQRSTTNVLLENSRLKNQGVIAGWLSSLLTTDDTGKRQFAEILLGSLFAGPIEKFGYRHLLLSKAPKGMAIFMRVEAAQRRFFEIQDMKSNDLSRMPNEHQRYLQRLRELPLTATLDDILRVDHEAITGADISNTRSSYVVSVLEPLSPIFHIGMESYPTHLVINWVAPRISSEQMDIDASLCETSETNFTQKRYR